MGLNSVTLALNELLELNVAADGTYQIDELIRRAGRFVSEVYKVSGEKLICERVNYIEVYTRAGGPVANAQREVLNLVSAYDGGHADVIARLESLERMTWDTDGAIADVDYLLGATPDAEEMMRSHLGQLRNVLLDVKGLNIVDDSLGCLLLERCSSEWKESSDLPKIIGQNPARYLRAICTAAKYLVVRLVDTQAPSPSSSPIAAETPWEQMKPVERAIALLVKATTNGEYISKIDLAKQAGCHRSTLHRSPRFVAAYTTYEKSLARPIPKGYFMDGNLEALDDE